MCVKIFSSSSSSSSSSFPFAVRRRVPTTTIFYILSYPGPVVSKFFSTTITWNTEATWLLGSRVRIRWGYVCSSVVLVVCCVCSGHCDELITHLEECYCLCVCVWFVNLKPRRPRFQLGCCATQKRSKYPIYFIHRLSFN
jgi:hypothetical protein